MQNALEHSDKMTAQDIFAAVHNLKKKLEENFVALGQLLSEIKKKKMYQAKGFDNFKDFVETEYNINSTLAGKLCSVYQVFVGDLEVDDVTMKQLGLDRLNIIKPFVKGKTYPDVEEWLQKAENMPIGELKKFVKDIKDKEKVKDMDVKDVLTNQFLERMLAEFNCSRKDLNFKLALYFQDADLEEIKKIIKLRQRQFESELQNSKEEKQ